MRLLESWLKLNFDNITEFDNKHNLTIYIFAHMTKKIELSQTLKFCRGIIKNKVIESCGQPLCLLLLQDMTSVANNIHFCMVLHYWYPEYRIL